jgi:hypothetical protein
MYSFHTEITRFPDKVSIFNSVMARYGIQAVFLPACLPAHFPNPLRRIEASRGEQRGFITEKDMLTLIKISDN